MNRCINQPLDVDCPREDMWSWVRPWDDSNSPGGSQLWAISSQCFGSWQSGHWFCSGELVGTSQHPPKPTPCAIYMHLLCIISPLHMRTTPDDSDRFLFLGKLRRRRTVRRTWSLLLQVAADHSGTLHLLFSYTFPSPLAGTSSGLGGLPGGWHSPLSLSSLSPWPPFLSQAMPAVLYCLFTANTGQVSIDTLRWILLFSCLLTKSSLTLLQPRGL